VAAFSLANRDSQSSADSEQARVNSSFVLKVGNDIQTGINRAVADGFPPANLSTNLKFQETTTAGELNLFDDTLKYLIRPQFPPTALAVPANQPFAASGTLEAAITEVAVDGVGVELENEAVITIANLKEDVCKRINVTVNGKIVTDAPETTLALAAAAGQREGCFGSDGEFSYFRVIATDVST
jgi:hypothetical protein